MPLEESTLNQLVDTVRRFVNERLIPLEEQVANDDLIPAEIIEEMKQLGLFGLTIPTEYGGLGLNTYEECQVVLELGRTAPAFRSIFGTNNGIGSQGLVMDGTQEQKDYYLPRLAAGEIIGSFALTEPKDTSPTHPMRACLRYSPAPMQTNQAPGELAHFWSTPQPQGYLLVNPIRRWASKALMFAMSF